MARQGYTFEPDVVFPPGDTLRELLQAREMTQVELAEKIDMSEKAISQILNGKNPLTQDTALKLERVLGVDASFWNNLEAKFQEFRVREEEAERLKQEMQFLKRFPTKEMIKRDWLPPLKGVALLRSLLRFFEVASPKAWENHWGSGRLAAFRKTNPGKDSEYAVAAWLRAGEIEAEKLDLQDFKKKKFLIALKTIREMIPNPPEDLGSRLVKECAEAGVALVLTPQLKGTGVAGATRWIHRTPILQLSLRHKTEDHFWFAFFHEAAHILLHGKTEVFWEGTAKAEGAPKEKEEQADRWARDILIEQEQWDQFLARTSYFTETNIIDFARSVGTTPGIVVGRLQHEKKIPFSHQRNLIGSVMWVDESTGQIAIS